MYIFLFFPLSSSSTITREEVPDFAVMFSSPFNRGVLCACVACFLTHSFTFEKKKI